MAELQEIESSEKGQKDIELRSAPVEDILSRPPHWLIRWGVTSIFIVIALVLIASWLIKYPDVMSGRATIKAENPVVIELSTINGTLTQLLIEDGAQVAENTPLISVENPLSSANYFLLQDFLVALDSAVPKHYGQLELKLDTGINYGSLQRSFNELSSAFFGLRELATRNIDSVRLQNLQQQVSNYKRLADIAKRQVELVQKELTNAQEKYKADQLLYEKGVYSKMEFIEMESLYRNKLSALENARQAEAQYAVTLTDYQKQLEELKYDLAEESRQLTVRFNSATSALKSEMANWEQTYILTSKKSGRVTFLTELFTGRALLAGEPLLAVVPENQDFYVSAEIPAANAGKVKVGQPVNIKLDNYNWQEYGMLKGKVASVAEVPTEGKYRVQIILNRSQTRLAQQMVLKPEMGAMVEIQANDLRLIERLFYQLKKVWERS